MNINKIIQSFAAEKNIIAGVCGAEDMEYLRTILNASGTPFVSRDIEKRTRPRAIMPGAESIIVIGVSTEARHTALDRFYINEREDDRAAQPERSRRVLGRLSHIGGTDYHLTVRRLLEELAELIGHHADFEYKIFVDAGHLVERELAVKAGLGFIGKNHAVISAELGSLFNIGYMLTNLALSVEKTDDVPRVMSCGECGRCIGACPGGALGRDGFSHTDCISYITQKKSNLTEREKELMGGHIYGCDICQAVCPCNEGHYQEYPIDAGALYSLPDDALSDAFRGSAAGWVGTGILRRNLKICLENANKGEH